LIENIGANCAADVAFR